MTVSRLILASESRSRRTLLSNAGLAFEIIGSDVDEAAIKTRLLAQGAAPGDIALTLAEAKAQAVDPGDGAYVIGADQVLDLGGALFDKPKGLDGVRRHIEALNGETHTLPTSVCVSRNGAVIWRCTETPCLTIRQLSVSFIDAYVEECGEAVQSSVGAYHLEGRGAQLFDGIEGSFFTILGLPLLPLLNFLRTEGVIDG